MYIPTHFEVTDRDALHAAIERYSFAVIVSGEAGQLVASHLPLLIDRVAAEANVLGVVYVPKNVSEEKFICVNGLYGIVRHCGSNKAGDVALREFLAGPLGAGFDL